MGDKRNKYSTWIGEHGTLLILSLIVFLGFSLRVYHLSHPSLWLDEAFTAGRVHGSLAQTFKTLKVSPHPPLYYLIMNPWTKVFGSSEFSLRFPSLVFSTLSIIFIFYLGRELFHTKVGLIAAFLLSVSPYSINYAQEAKMYSMIWCLSICSFFFFVRFIKEQTKKDLVLYILSSSASLYTQYTGFLFLIAQNAFYFSQGKNKKTKPWLVGQGIIILSYLPWAYNAFYNMQHKSGITWVHSTSNHVAKFIQIFRVVSGDYIIAGADWAAFSSTFEFIFWGLLTLCSLLYLLFSFFRKDTRGLIKRTNIVIVILWWLFPYLVLALIDKMFTPILVIRYLGYSHIPVIILISLGIFILNLYLPYSKHILLIIIMAVTFPLHLVPYYKNDLKINGANFRGVINELCQRLTEDSLFLETRMLKCCRNPLLKYYETCLQGKKPLPVNYKIPIDQKKIFLLYWNKKNAAPHIITLKEQGFQPQEELEIDLFGFIFFTKDKEQEIKNNEGSWKKQFFQRVISKVNSYDLIITPYSISPFSQYGNDYNVTSAGKFKGKIKQNRSYYKKYESIFIIYNNEKLIWRKNFLGYKLKERYSIRQTKGKNYLGYLWFIKIR